MPNVADLPTQENPDLGRSNLWLLCVRCLLRFCSVTCLLLKEGLDSYDEGWRDKMLELQYSVRSYVCH